jgi:hypothetical protein
MSLSRGSRRKGEGSAHQADEAKAICSWASAQGFSGQRAGGRSGMGHAPRSSTSSVIEIAVKAESGATNTTTPKKACPKTVSTVVRSFFCLKFSRSRRQHSNKMM